MTDLRGYQVPELRGKEPVDVKMYGSQHSPDDSVYLVYYLKSDDPIEKVAQRVAEEETTGRWIGGGSPTPTFKKARAEVVKLEKYNEHEGIVHILSPLWNLSFDERWDPFYQLAMISVGGPILEFVFYQRVSFLDFKLPDRLLRRFPGPKFGISGTREFIGLKPDEPIIGTIVKPCAGLEPEEVASKVYEAALGGAVLMKDDEKMMNPDYCPFDRKVKLVSEKLKAAEREIGKRVIYCPQLNARPDKIKDAARRAIGLGATGIMFNSILANGFSTISILAEDPEINVPIYVHSGGRSALSTGPRRIEDPVIAKLVRILGGDYFQIGVANQRSVHVASLDDELLKQLAYVMREEELPGIKPSLPITAGGLGAMNLGDNFRMFGYDIGALAGSNILDHPDGPKAGAIAMYQAAEAYRLGVPLAEYAKSHPELAALM